MKRLRSVTRRFNRRQRFVLAACAVLAIGLNTLLASYLIGLSGAATPFVAAEPELGTLSAPAVSGSDSTASGGAYTRFAAPASGGRIVNVSTAAQLTSALANAAPGDTITLADGTYSGQFNSTRSGTSTAPITVTGSRLAVINGGSLGSGYTFSLGTKNSASTASYWKLIGFTITGGQKGLMLDNVQNSIIDGLSIHDVGQEALHLRNFSSNNTVQNNVITKAGLDQQAYGEGIYVGTAVSNWDTFSQGKADRSNNNKILNNTVSRTGAENIDIKEGTHGGLVQGNSFDGTGMCTYSTSSCNFGDSMMDLKGEGWTVSGNTFSHQHAAWSSGTPTNDGVQVHVISGGAAEGSGNNNIFKSNTVTDVDGYGFNIQSSATGVKVYCDNQVSNADKGFGNVSCTP
jgi:hypothetical protein